MGFIFNAKQIQKNSIKFPKLRICEDQVFLFNYLTFTKKIQLINGVVYVHTANPNGLSTDFKKLKHIGIHVFYYGLAIALFVGVISLLATLLFFR